MSNETPWHDRQKANEVAKDVAESRGHLAICDRCGGTGNELYSMYRKCSQCDGVGANELVDGAGNGDNGHE